VRVARQALQYLILCRTFPSRVFCLSLSLIALIATVTSRYITHIPSSRTCLHVPQQVYRVSGNNEQGQRASIRQVALDLGMELINTTLPELETLKDANVIGKRAPCAAMLSLADAVRLLQGS